MVSVSEVWKTWQKSFTNKDSSKLVEFFIDDLEMVSASGTRNRQQTLDWVSAGGSPTSIGNLAVLCGNDDNTTLAHDADTVAATPGEFRKGQAMVFYAKRVGKIPQCRVVRTEV